MNQYATRLWAALLTLSLLLPLAACGKNTTATTMYLKRTEGTVTVSDSAGKDVPLLENLGLYSGYGVDTSSESYAWISLNDVKLTKMDQESEIAIQKEGKNLEIEIKSGSLFFNVTQPLEDDETMDIRTSTMLIGIRGTCGWMEDRDGLSREYILEGTVECSAVNQTVQVNAGEMAELMADGNLVVQPFTVQDIPSFVLEDLVQDLGLCSDIYDASGLDVLGAAGGEEDAEQDFENDTLGIADEEDAEQDFGDDILAALANAKDGEVIKLNRMYTQTVESTIHIYGGSADNPVVLDLNGYLLDLPVNESISDAISVHGALQIRDSSGTGDGMLSPNGYISLDNSASLFLDSGAINYVVMTYDNSTFTMYGGWTGVVEASDNSTITLNDGLIYIANVSDNSALTIYGGTIGAVGTFGNSTCTMYDGLLEELSEWGDRRVSMEGNSTFNMYGGTINGEVAPFDSSTFNMYGGTINGEVAPYGNSTFNQNGGEVNH